MTMKVGAGTPGTDCVRVGERDYIFKPGRQRPAGKFGVVLLHGSGAPIQYASVASWASGALAGLIAQAGIPCIAAEMSGQAFGNDAAMTDIGNAINYLAAQTGVPSTKIHVIGISMGAYTGLRYAANNVSKVASFTGIIPLCDLDYIYQGNVGGLRAQIGTAWGVTYPTALPAGAIISSSAAALNGVVPSQMYYSTVDALIPTAQVTTMGTTIGASPVTAVDSTYGHNEGSIQAAVDLGGAGTAQQIINFLIANGA